MLLAAIRRKSPLTIEKVISMCSRLTGAGACSGPQAWRLDCGVMLSIVYQVAGWKCGQ